MRRAVRGTEPVVVPLERKHRPDIQGLRAIAVVAVVLYHANLGVPGGFIGVDVFFVISGFLITRQLIDLFGHRRARGFVEFYTRRIRRILPASLLVTACTVVAFRFLGPPLLVRSVGIDGLFTSGYIFNYRLIVEGTQYLGATLPPSPLQNYWSLAVEEQFYLVWPLLIFVVAAIARPHWRRPALAVALSAVAGWSLYLCITSTPTSPSWAYFSLPTRAWELAFGGLVALVASRTVGLSRPIRELMAWVGLLGILVSAFLITAHTEYPGYAAVLPVAAAALLIAAGTGSPCGPERVLAEPALQGIGAVSYSWYLWHWPLLILAPFLVGHALDVEGRVDVVAVSLALAIATYFALENPVRRLRRSHGSWLRSGLVMTGGCVVACMLVLSNLPNTTGLGGAVAARPIDSIGGAPLEQVQTTLQDSLWLRAVPKNLTPTIADAAYDFPQTSYDGCFLDLSTVVPFTCAFGDLKAKRTAVLFGDSHMQQWLPGIAAAAQVQHWRIVAYNKAACPVANITVFSLELNRQYTQCTPWRNDVLRDIRKMHPQLIIASQSDGNSGTIPASTWGASTGAAVAQLVRIAPVDFILDDPEPANRFDIPDCLAEHLDDAAACSYPLSKSADLVKRAAVAEAVRQNGATVVSPDDWMCTPTTCPAIAGNILIYRDDAHVTAAYSRWLAPLLAGLLPTESVTRPGRTSPQRGAHDQNKKDHRR
jgi:peptidoglycan/LPS O-acetylase OafA/YrhL